MPIEDMLPEPRDIAAGSSSFLFHFNFPALAGTHLWLSKLWAAGRVSIPRPYDCEPSALPLSYARP